MKKWLMGFLTFAGMALLAAVICGALVLWGVGRSLCASTVHQDVHSPNGRYHVVVFERNCGATTGFRTHILLLSGGTSLGDRRGNVFQADGHPDWFDIVVEWQDDTHLLIETNGKPIPDLMEDRVRGIDIAFVENTEGVVSPRPFSPSALFLPVELFPAGWTAEELRFIGTEVIRGSKENHPYKLFTPPGAQYPEAKHSVSRMDNSEEAASDMEINRTALEKTYSMGSAPAQEPLPAEVSFQSTFADDMALFCTEHEYGDSGDPTCTMIARYEEFYIEFSATVQMDGCLTYAEFDALVEAVDAIMMEYLQE